MKGEELKKLKLGLGGCMLLLLLLLSAKEDRFQKVISHQTDVEVVSKLETFHEGGIERSIEHKDYESEKVISNAFSFIGTPAHFGGLSHKGIDCSGLVMMAHKSCGVVLPRTAEEQARYGIIIPSMEKLQRGDVVFFYNSYRTSKFITHTGIYLGENKFIHTSSTKGVVVSRIDDPYFWKERFLFGTRLGS